MLYRLKGKNLSDVAFYLFNSSVIFGYVLMRDGIMHGHIVTNT